MAISVRTFLRSIAGLAIVLAGGYAVNVNDTFWIHTNTAKVAKEVLDRLGWRTGAASG